MRGSPPPPPRPSPLIIDCDPGIDDLAALALAVRSPEVDLIAVTTVAGNATLARTTRNARRLLALAGRPDIPVLPGAAAPLARDPVPQPERHGPEGAGDAETGPAPEVPADPDALVAALTHARTPPVLVTLGPMTNLALAVRAGLPPVGRHLAMAGGTARADFNAWADPEALEIVLAAGPGTDLVPLDVTRHMAVTPADVTRLRDAGDPLSRWLGAALGYRLTGARALHDVLPVAEAITPGLLDTGFHRVKIGRGDTDRGRVLAAADGHPVRIAGAVDAARARTLLDRVLGPHRGTLEGGA